MKKQTVARIISALLVVCMMSLTSCDTIIDGWNDNGLNAGNGSTTPDQGGGSTVTPSDDSNKDQENTDSDTLTILGACGCN